ncbi:MAG TPA: TIGR03557 family F420-dependent LLM class oxidoreductase [Methylomirabilota bacterium]|nr:TIGR03557 family F420-dependent LLM class oxidoreductase [Methylomirabilota bacterium]
MPLQIGYQLSSEEHRPSDLVRYARLAEAHGFAFAAISDHFHPWIDAQGQSPFVWSVIGSIAQATDRLGVGTWVTCPTTRMHPAVVAHAAATSAAMMPGRFFLGLGTGENLNEHIVGQGWPETDIRQARLEEAIAVIRLLWQGGFQSHHGRFYTVENARLYTLPERPPPLLVAVGGPKSAELAGGLADGLIATDADAELVSAFDAAGGRDKPRYGSVTVCWARDAQSARKTAHRIWPTAAMESSLSWELPLPQHFEQAAKHVTEDAVAEVVVCGPDPEPYVTAIRKYVDAGFDHVVIHQVGPEQEGFFAFYKRELAPALGSLKPKRPAKAGSRPRTRRAA